MTLRSEDNELTAQAALSQLDSSVPAADMVGIACHIVPGGLMVPAKGGKLVGRATLVLTPTAAQPGAASVAIADWPLEIEKLLAAGIDADFRPAGAPVSSAKHLKLRRAGGKSWAANGAVRGNIGKLWQAALSDEGDGGAFGQVLTALETSRARGLHDEIARAPIPVVASAPGTANKGTANKGTEKADTTPVPDVIVAPKGDIALLQLFQRAGRVARALMLPEVGKAETHAGLSHYDRLRRPGAWFQKPWARPPSPAETQVALGLPLSRWGSSRVAQGGTLLAAAEGPVAALALINFQDPNFLPANDKVGRSRVDDINRALTEELYCLELGLKPCLDAQRQRADKMARIARDLRQQNLATDCANKLDQWASARMAGLTAQECAAACRGVGGDKADALANPAIGVNLASQFPDWKAADSKTGSEAQNRLFALQSQPALARLFNLAVDVEFDLDEDGFPDAKNDVKDGWFSEETLKAHCAIKDEQKAGDTDAQGGVAPPATAAKSKAAQFVEVRARPAGATGTAGSGFAPAVWTLAKYRVPRDIKRTRAPGADRGHFWAMTREELLIARWCGASEAQRLRAAVLDQIDGIVNLAASHASANGVVHRYELTSLDVVHDVAELVQHDRAVAAREGAPPITGDEDGVGSHTMRTAGLVLIDRWRQSAVISEIASSELARTAESGREMVKDATDLTIGFKLDIAILPAGETHRRWRSLMNRKISYFPPKTATDQQNAAPGWIDQTINALLPDDVNDPAEEKRFRMDAATIAMPSRLRGNQSDDRAKSTAFSEEIVATWDGDPLGLRAGAETVSVPKGGLAIDINYALPQARDLSGKVVPHNLRLGWPYWLGARPVCMGCVSLPLERAAARYEITDGGATLPRSTAEMRRFLRHERVGAPMVAVPETVILDEIKTPRAPVEGQAMVVRGFRAAEQAGADSAAGEEWRYGPAETTRALFAPPVDLSFAHWHGVFDKAGIMEKPADGLQSVDYDAQWGGFPIYWEQDGSVQVARVKGERPPAKACGVLSSPQAGTTQAPPSGPAVYRKRQSAAKDRGNNAYFPDPAAREMIVALRRRDADRSYLEGPAFSVPLYPATGSSEPVLGYPDAQPLLITVRRINARPEPAGRRLSHDDIKARTKNFLAVEPIDPAKGPDARNRQQRLTLCLAPGEDFDVEVWCRPSAILLGRWFDVPESLALLLKDHSGPADDQDRSCMQALAKLNPDIAAADMLKILTKVMRVDGQDNKACRAGATVNIATIKGVAQVLHDALGKRPISEIAAVRRLRAVHAIERPLLPPSFDTEFAPRVLRVSKEEYEKALMAGAGKQAQPDWPGWDQKDNVRGSGVVQYGALVRLDPNETGALELRVLTCSPRGGPIDDPKRGRTAQQRAEGSWPFPVEDGEGAARDESRAAAARLFGFGFDDGGRVTLPREEIIVGSWPIRPMSDTGAGALVDLWALTCGDARVDAKDDTKAKAAKAPRDDRFFGDSKARRLLLSVAGLSRSASFIPERLTYPIEAQKLLDLQRGHARRWLPMVDGKPADAETVEVVLRATERPAAIAPKSLLPAFVWKAKHDGDRKETDIERTTKIRIRIQRPWFSSGEDERLGIVLWPPNLLDAANAAGKPLWREQELEAGMVRRDVALHPDDRQLMNLAGFVDADLGPGGVFVTRLGADPIRADGSAPWFLPPSAFKDFSATAYPPLDANQSGSADSGVNWPADRGHLPRMVTNVLMPVPEGESPDPGTARVDPELMTVSLMTYAPKFDPDYEYWYVDVDIDPGHSPDPFLRLGLVRYQPHAPRELQVSAPVVEWVQIVGYARRANARLDVENVRRCDGSLIEVPTINVRISGPAAGYVAHDISDEPDAPTAVLGRATFRATLYECRETASRAISESVGRRTVCIDGETRTEIVGGDAAGHSGCPVCGVGKIERELAICQSPAVGSAGEMWSCKFRLPPGYASGPGARIRYAVLVEEVEKMRPATYANEPVFDEPAEPSVESGPRFAVRFDI